MRTRASAFGLLCTIMLVAGCASEPTAPAALPIAEDSVKPDIEPVAEIEPAPAPEPAPVPKPEIEPEPKQSVSTGSLPREEPVAAIEIPEIVEEKKVVPTPAPPTPAPPIPDPSPAVEDVGGEVSVEATKAGLTRIGAGKCKICHKLQFNSWSETAHALRTPPLDCESCHGPGSEYKKKSIMKDPELARAAGMVIPESAFCEQCHTQDWSDELLTLAHEHKVEELETP